MDHHAELVGKIAREVYQSLGSGFSEDVYDRAMQVGLRLVGVEYESQKVVELKYRDYYVGEGYPDLLVHLGKQKVVVELKAVSSELGECVAVDCAQTDPKQLTGKIIVTWQQDNGLVLSHFLLVNGTSLLESENRDYEAVRLGKNRNWRIIGRVLWWIRKAP